MIDKCLSAPESVRFDTFDAISENDYRWRDTSHAKEALGWRPTGRAEDREIGDPGGWHQVLAGDQKLRREPGRPA